MRNRQTEREGEYVDTESESEAWLVGQLVIDRGKGQNSEPNLPAVFLFADLQSLHAAFALGF